MVVHVVVVVDLRGDRLLFHRLRVHFTAGSAEAGLGPAAGLRLSLDLVAFVLDRSGHGTRRDPGIGLGGLRSGLTAGGQGDQETGGEKVVEAGGDHGY